MLTRNDSIILGQQVDVNKALDLLKMFQEAGKEKIDVWTILDESAPKIKSFATLEAKLEQLAGNHETCNVSEFSNWMKVSRSTVYTWRDNNYLIYSGNKVNLPETLRLWKTLPWLESKYHSPGTGSCSRSQSHSEGWQ